MIVAATLSLNPEEAGILDAALRYYVDTLTDPEEADDDDRIMLDKAERIRLRMRKSLERRGYRLELKA